MIQLNARIQGFSNQIMTLLTFQNDIFVLHVLITILLTGAVKVLEL